MPGARLKALPPPQGWLAERRLLPGLKGVVGFGILVAIGFFAVGGYWAATAPLSGAVVAPGVVSPEGSRRVVQHLEGGIIHEIKVRNGDRVQQGEVLAILRSVTAESEVAALQSRLRSLAAEEARLHAERARAESIDFRHEVLQEQNDVEVRGVLDAERRRFQARRQGLTEERGIFEQQITQLQEQIAGHRVELANIDKQLAFVTEEVGAVQTLHDKGLERKPRLLALKRGVVELKGEKGRLDAEIAKTEVRISEIKLRVLNIETRFEEQVEDRLAQVQAQRSEVEASLRDKRDRLTRTTVVAPASGTAINLRFKTTGAVARPGEPIVDIVPSEDELVIEARVSPRDVDQAMPGQPVSVVFTSFPTRHMLRVRGDLESVSADVIEDERTGEGYYAARIKVYREELSQFLQEHELIPGLPVEVYIETGKQTLLEYLAKPLMTTLMRSFREF